MRRPLDELEAEEDEEDGDDKALAVKDDPSFTIAVTRGKKMNVLFTSLHSHYCLRTT